MSTPISRADLDRRMAAWSMYYSPSQRKSTKTIAAHFGVTPQSIRNWIISLGGVLDDDEHERAFRDKIAVALGVTEMLCSSCDIICDADPSGLCPTCQGEQEYTPERQAWIEFESRWLDRNLCKVVTR